jgi:putative CocE/NonD family hydrolase
VPCLETPFYFTRQELTQDVPEQEEILSYLYDPQAPAPTLGGCNLFMEAGPKDQASLEQRSDTLVFTTEPLEQDLEVTGRVRSHLFFASDQKDTDVVVRVTDVYPDGRSILVLDGLHRTAHCHCHNPELNPKDPREIDVDLWSTSMVFAKGHRIRVSVTSSNYPKYEKNLNVGMLGANNGIHRIAHNSFYTGGKRASYILLPIAK